MSVGATGPVRWVVPHDDPGHPGEEARLEDQLAHEACPDKHVAARHERGQSASPMRLTLGLRS